MVAFGAGDIHLAFALGNAHRLTALGTLKIAMFPIPQRGKETQKPAIFPLTDGNFPRIRPIEGINENAVGQTQKAPPKHHSQHHGDKS